MKKFLSLLIAVIMVISVFPATCGVAGEIPTDDTVIYTVNGATANGGRRLDVSIDMSNNKNGLWGSVFYLKYNKEALKLIESSVANGNLWDPSESYCDISIISDDNSYEWARGAVYFGFSSDSMNNAVTTESGTVATLSFDILDGELDAGIEYLIWNKDGNNHATVTDGVIKPAGYEVQYNIDTSYEPVVYTVKGQRSENGLYLDVSVDMSNNTDGLWGAVFYMKYNSDAILPVESSFAAGDVWESENTTCDISLIGDDNYYEWAKNTVYFGFSSNSSYNGTSKESGTVATLRFRVIDDSLDSGIEYLIWNGDKNNHAAVFDGVIVPLGYEVEYDIDMSYFSDGPVTYSVQGKRTNGGKYLDVTIDMSGNRYGLWGSVFYLKYNTDALLPVESSLTAGDVWDPASSTCDVSLIGNDNEYEWAKNTVYVGFLSDSTSNGTTVEKGTVATLRFEVLDDTVDDGIEYLIWNGDKGNHTSVIDGVLEAIDYTVTYSIDMSYSEPDYTIGDITGDTVINSQDIFRMKLFVNTIVEPTAEERLAADINGDGLINSRDVFMLCYRVLIGEWS